MRTFLAYLCVLTLGLAFGLYFGYEIGRTEIPVIAVAPEPDCADSCVWDIIHSRIQAGKRSFTAEQFNKFTYRCNETCNRAYDESFGSDTDAD